MTDDQEDDSQNILITTILSIPNRPDIVWSSSSSWMPDDPIVVTSIIRNTLNGHITHLTLEAEELEPKEVK